MTTAGTDDLPAAAFAQVIAAVARFDAFTSGNDPHGEHDCAALTAAGYDVIWKIDSYDLALQYHSPDSADPSVTKRVLTMMLAEEY